MKTKTEKQTRWTTWQDLSQLSEVIEMTNLDVKKKTTKTLFVEIDINDLCPDKEWTQEHLKQEITKMVQLAPLYTNAVRFDITRTVVCADCGETCPEFLESAATRMPDHDGIWADCSECGLTGVE